MGGFAPTLPGLSLGSLPSLQSSYADWIIWGFTVVYGEYVLCILNPASNIPLSMPDTIPKYCIERWQLPGGPWGVRLKDAVYGWGEALGLGVGYERYCMASASSVVISILSKKRSRSKEQITLG